MTLTAALLAAFLVSMILPLAAPADRDRRESGIGAEAATVTGAVPPLPTGSAGPEKWDASGRVKCSVDRPSFDRTCGFRLVRHRRDKITDIWIRNLARAKASYRILRYANQTFTAADDSSVTAQLRGHLWQVTVGGKEFYLIPEALMAAD